MAEGHALLAPSAPSRCPACPAWVGLADPVPEGRPGLPAREGTAAHRAAELEASRRFGRITAEEYEAEIESWRQDCEASDDPLDVDEMLDYAREYAEKLALIAGDLRDPAVWLERKVDPGVPECWGTADAVILSRGRLDVIDYKYGQGIFVHAMRNPQTMLYGLGALDQFNLLDDIEEVHLHIIQPRIGKDGSWLTYVTTPEELYEWRGGVVLPAAELALGDDAPFGPSEVACRWCPLSGICRAQLESIVAADFAQPDVLTPDEIADALERASAIESWAKALREKALSLAYEDGEEIPGWKVVRGSGRRSIPDSAAADRLLSTYPIEFEDYGKVSLLPLGTLEKRRSKPEDPESPSLLDVLTEAGLVVKGEGRLTLAPESDRRPAVSKASQAAEDFGPLSD